MNKTTYLLMFSVIFVLFSCGEKEKPPKTCDSGFEYRKDWDSCVDINECKTNNGNCSDICTNKVGSFECSCNEGFKLEADNKTCVDIDECKTSNGGCEQICSNSEGAFSCSCNENFVLNDDGKTCKDLDNCKDNPCNKHGNCIDGDDAFTCACFAAYKGDTCNECQEGYELYSTECVSSDIVRWHPLDDVDKIVEPESLAIDSNNNIYVVGRVESSWREGEGNNIFMSKITEDLEVVWSKEFKTSLDDDHANVAIDSNDNVYLSFATKGLYIGAEKGSGNDVVLIKIDTDANVKWSKQFVTDATDTPNDMKVDSNNNIYIVGHRKMNKVFIKKLDNSGDELWSKELVIGAANYHNKIDLDEDNNLYVTATTSSAVSGTTHIGLEDILVMKFNSNGDKVWYKEVGKVGKDNSRNIRYKNNYIYIVGTADISSSSRYGDGSPYIAKLNKDGNLIFDKTYTAGVFDSNSIDINENNEIFIGGSNMEDILEFKQFVKKLDNNGEIIWEKEWINEHARNSSIISMELDHSDSLVMMGLFDHELFTSKFTF